MSSNEPVKGTESGKINKLDINKVITIIFAIAGTEFGAVAVENFSDFQNPYIARTVTAAVVTGIYFVKQWLSDNSNIIYNPKKKQVEQK